MFLIDLYKFVMPRTALSKKRYNRREKRLNGAPFCIALLRKLVCLVFLLVFPARSTVYTCWEETATFTCLTKRYSAGPREIPRDCVARARHWKNKKPFGKEGKELCWVHFWIWRLSPFFHFIAEKSARKEKVVASSPYPSFSSTWLGGHAESERGKRYGCLANRTRKVRGSWELDRVPLLQAFSSFSSLQTEPNSLKS